MRVGSDKTKGDSITDMLLSGVTGEGLANVKQSYNVKKMRPRRIIESNHSDSYIYPSMKKLYCVCNMLKWENTKSGIQV